MPEIIVAGNYRQAVDWCKQNDVDLNTCLIITSDRDAYRLQGHRFTAEQVHRVGTWYDNRMTTVSRMLRERLILPGDPDGS